MMWWLVNIYSHLSKLQLHFMLLLVTQNIWTMQNPVDKLVVPVYNCFCYLDVPLLLTQKKERNKWQQKIVP